MATSLDNLTLTHDEDDVSCPDGAESMGDHNHGLLSLLQKQAKRLLDLVLALGVECTSGLVEEQDAWLADEGASDGNALLLST